MLKDLEDVVIDGVTLDDNVLDVGDFDADFEHFIPEKHVSFAPFAVCHNSDDSVNWFEVIFNQVHYVAGMDLPDDYYLPHQFPIETGLDEMIYKCEHCKSRKVCDVLSKGTARTKRRKSY